MLPPMIVEVERKDPLVSSLYITDIGYYPKAYNHFRERKEPISQYVLIYCMEGEGWYKLDGKTYHVAANQYFILPPFVPHTYWADKQHPWTIYWIHFTGQHAGIYSEESQEPQEIRPAMNSRISVRQHIFEEIFTTLEQNTDSESLRYTSSLLHYYLASMRYLRLYRKEQHEKEDVITATIHYMHENLERKITLNQLAHYAGYSPSHFSLLFRQQTGESPTAYLNKLKIEHACLLMKKNSMHVNEVCHKVGINDSYYFSRLFKLIKGISPQQYMRKFKESPQDTSIY